jgi:hypothetical protein
MPICTMKLLLKDTSEKSTHVSRREYRIPFYYRYSKLLTMDKVTANRCQLYYLPVVPSLIFNVHIIKNVVDTKLENLG